MDLKNTLNKLSADIEEVTEWADGQYEQFFAPYFRGQVKLYERLKSSEDPITDQELEWILTDLPLDLFTVTEQLSKLKVSQEVIKHSIKKREREYLQAATEGSETKRKEEAAALVADDKLLVTVYDSIADRVSRQMTFSKELIMSAKKIWDTRRADGTLMPEVNTTKEATLPDYDMSNIHNQNLIRR